MRIGKASQTLELVAPKTGIGLVSSDQPMLCYLLAGPVTLPLRFIIGIRNQVRPIADLPLPPVRPQARLGVVDLHDYKLRLTEHEVYVWSVSVSGSSQDLMAGALIEYRSIDAARSPELRAARARRDYALLEANGYWYDAAMLAAENRDHDGGAGLQQVLRAMGSGGSAGTE